MGSHAQRVVATALLAVLCLSLAGCPRAADDATDDGKPVIALVMKSLANEFFSTMEQGARDHHAAHAEQFKLLVDGIRNETDLDQQVRLVEQMIAQRVDAIVIAPADSKALAPVCKRALDAGIVVINIDNQFDAKVLADSDATIPFVGPDNRAGARKVGELLAKELAAGDEVAILEGIPTAFNAQQRRLGFEDAMNAAGMKIVDVQSGQWEMDKANTVAAAIVGEHPKLKALLCSNDTMALGAVAAVKTAGKADQIRIVGYDNISAVQELLRNGTVLATADQHADRLAVFGIEYALEALTSDQPPADKRTPVDLVTADTLK